MKQVKFIMFKKPNGRQGVVESMQLEDDSWLLIDTYLDLSKSYGIAQEYDKIGRENIVGCFESFNEVKNFIKLICGHCDVVWL